MATITNFFDTMSKHDNLSSEVVHCSPSLSAESADHSLSTQELLDFDLSVSESLTTHDNLPDKAYTLEEDAVKLDVPILPKMSLEPHSDMERIDSGSPRKRSSSTLKTPFDAQLLFHTTNSLIIKDIDELLPKNNVLSKDVHCNSHNDEERRSSTTISNGNNMHLSASDENRLPIESTEHTFQEMMLRFQDMEVDEKLYLEQNINFICDKLENMQGNSVIHQKFLKLFKLYVALLADNQDSITHVYRDKYVQFLLSYEKLTIDSDLQTIIERFTLHPSNIYMKLARLIYENNDRLARKSLEIWNLKKAKNDCFKTLAKRVDLQILKRIFLLWTKKLNKHIKAEQESLDFRNFTLFSLNLKKWTKRASLQNEMSSVADQKQQQMVLKTVFQTKIFEIERNLLAAQRLYATTLSGKSMNHLLLQYKCTNFMRRQCHGKKKQFFSMLVSKKMRLDNQYSKALLVSKQKGATKVLNDQWITKCRNLSAMKSKADLVFMDKSFDKWFSKCQNQLQADDFYYYKLKQKLWKGMILHTVTKLSQNYKKSYILSRFKNKEKQCVHLAQVSNEVYAMQSLRFFLHKWRQRLQKVEGLQIILENNYTCTSHNSVVPMSYKKVFFNKWSLFYMSLREQKLNLLLEDHLQDKAEVQKKRVLAVWLRKLGTLHSLDVTADYRFDRFTTAQFFQKLSVKLSSMENLRSEAKSFDKFLIQRRIFDHLLNFHISIEDLKVYAEERKVLKNMKTASYFMNRWGIRRMRIQNNNDNAKSIRTRWNRARARGLLNVWEDRMRENLRNNLFTDNSKMQTPFSFGGESVLSDNRSPVLEPVLPNYFVNEDSPIRNSRGPHYLSATQNNNGKHNNKSSSNSSSSRSSSSEDASSYSLKTPTRFSATSQWENNSNNTEPVFSNKQAVDSKSAKDRMMQLSFSARKNRYRRTISRPSPIKETLVLSSAIKQRLMASQYETPGNTFPTEMGPRATRSNQQKKPRLGVTPQLDSLGD